VVVFFGMDELLKRIQQVAPVLRDCITPDLTTVKKISRSFPSGGPAYNMLRNVALQTNGIVSGNTSCINIPCSLTRHNF
jgi:hypothetical protein